MQLYFNSIVAGGDFNQDFGDPNNFWQDFAWTIPNGNLPTTSDDVQLNDSVMQVTTAVSVHNLTTTGSGFSNSNGSGTLSLSGTATGISFNTLYINGITAVGCSFNANGSIFSINGSGSCSYTVPMGSAITDDGTGSFSNGNTFSGNISYSGNLNPGGGVTFTSTVSATEISSGNFSGAPINCNNITGGSFTGSTINQSGNITLVGLMATTITVNWSAVLSIVSVTVFGSNVSFVPTYTNPIYVLTGQSSGGSGGSLTIPSSANVRSGVIYGSAGNSNTGTLRAAGTVGYAG